MNRSTALPLSLGLPLRDGERLVKRAQAMSRAIEPAMQSTQDRTLARLLIDGLLRVRHRWTARRGRTTSLCRPSLRVGPLDERDELLEYLAWYRARRRARARAKGTPPQPIG